MTSISNCFYSEKRSDIKALCYALLASMLMGCDAPGTARLKELRENEGFPKVYQQVSADGYYDGRQECGDTIRFFSEWNFGFVECEQTTEMPLGLSNMGLHRISKVDRDSGLCNEDLEQKFQKYRLRFEQLKKQGICFFVETIESPAARYGIFNGDNYVLELKNIFGSIISAQTMYIKEMDSDELIAEDKAFFLYPTPGFTLSSFQRMEHCNTVVPGNRDIPSLNQVNAYIKPEMTNRESSHGNNRGDLSGSSTR